MRRLTRVLVTLAVAAATLLGGQLAQAADGFRFHGSGYGHGIGMSQWGAYGLAKRGWTYERILRHFYSATRVVHTSSLPKQLRVGLTSGRSKIHVKAKNGPVRLWLDGPGTTFVTKIPWGKTWTVIALPAKKRFAIRDQDGVLVGRFGGPASPLFATYADAGARAFVPEADEVFHQGFAYAYGFLEFGLTDCASGCRERLTIQLPFELYLRGLGEMPSSWPAAALRTQAVAARSYATYQIRRNGLQSWCDCHLIDGAGDQVYVGFNKESGVDGDRWVAAVRATEGQVVTYGGSVIQAFYAASDGGYTENVEDVWHGGNPAYAVPYLRGVCDPGEATSANPWLDWTRSFTAASVSMRLSPYTGGIGTIRRFTNVRRGVSGRIVSASAVGGKGTASVSGSELRSALGLPDGRVWINQDRTILGSIRSVYDGLMCRPGLPVSGTATYTHGSRQLFAIGGIYRNAQVDLTIWLKGALHGEYLAVGGAGGRLGLPVANVARTPASFSGPSCSSCRRIVLEHGRIYFKAGVGAHALWGPVLSAYLGKGGASGPLGYPTTRVRRVSGVARAAFEHGSIACANGSCDVQVA